MMTKLKLISLGLITSMFMICFIANSVYADISSTNYEIKESNFTGGGGNASSTNYELVETAFVQFGGSDATSTNYEVNNKIGISGGAIATIDSITPASFTKYYSDATSSYTVNATSQDGDTLQYGAKQGAITKVNAQASNTVSWNLSNSDIGRHTMTLQAIDPDGTSITTKEAFVVRRPVK